MLSSLNSLFKLHTLAWMCALALGSLHPAGTVQAQSLVDLYQAASSYDAAFQGAKAQYEANLARAAQAKSGLYPSVSLSANLSGTNSDVNKPTPAPDPNRAFGSQSA
ncbi:MAG: hypothetical protein HC858_10035, partial [Brachymonas sp.]|nr:hypothetical protein [Brachymonas sp.]